MNPDERRHWAWLVRQCRALGIASGMYEMAGRTLCEAFADYVHCRRLAYKHGLVLVGEKDGKPTVFYSPAATEMRRHRMDYLRLLCEFGLTPSAKAKVETLPGDQGDEAQYFNVVSMATHQEAQ